jgi:hypothetical protein
MCRHLWYYLAHAGGQVRKSKTNLILYSRCPGQYLKPGRRENNRGALERKRPEKSVNKCEGPTEGHEHRSITNKGHIILQCATCMYVCVYVCMYV